MVAIIQSIKTSPQLCAPLLEQFLQLNAANVNDHFVLRFMDLGPVILKMNKRAVSDYKVIWDRYVHLLKNFVQNYPEIVYKSLIEQGTDVQVDFKQVLNIIAQLLHQRP